MGMLTGAAAMENSTVVPFKTKNRATIRSTNPTPEHILNRTIIQKAACTPVFTAALFPVAKAWKQPKCPLTGEW